MKAGLTKKEYREFSTSVDFLKKEHDIDIPFIVEEIEGVFMVELLNPEDINTEFLDNLLENT